MAITGMTGKERNAARRERKRQKRLEQLRHDTYVQQFHLLRAEHGSTDLEREIHNQAIAHESELVDELQLAGW